MNQPITHIEHYALTVIKRKNEPSKFHGKNVIQTDEIDIEFSKVFTEYIKNIQHQNSERPNLYQIFTNDVFTIIYRYLSILEKSETQNASPVQRS